MKKKSKKKMKKKEKDKKKKKKKQHEDDDEEEETFPRSGGPTSYIGPDLYVAHASMHIDDLSYTQMMSLQPDSFGKVLGSFAEVGQNGLRPVHFCVAQWLFIRVSHGILMVLVFFSEVFNLTGIFLGMVIYPL